MTTPPSNATLRRACMTPWASAGDELSARWGREAVRAALKRGDLTRIARGVFAPSIFGDTIEVRARAALVACDPKRTGRAAITGVAALFLGGVLDQPPERLMVVLDRHHHVTRVPQLVTLYRSSRQPQTWVNEELILASPEWALLHPMREVPAGQRADFALYALGRHRIDVEALAATCDEASHAKGRRDLLVALSAHMTGIDSPLEFRGRREVLTGPEFAGLRWQFEITVEQRRFRVDAFDPETMLAIEFDGRRFHEGEARWDSDRQRDAILASVGILTLRLTNDMIKDGPDRCRSLVLRTMRARRVRGAA